MNLNKTNLKILPDFITGGSIKLCFQILKNKKPGFLHGFRTQGDILIGVLVSPLMLMALFIFADITPLSGEIKVKIPLTINLSAEEIKKQLPKEFKKKDFSIELLVYYYTDSVETLNFTEEKGMSEYESDGILKAILKIKKNNKAVKTAVIKTAGKSRESIIKNLLIEINKILAEQNLN